jgi:Tse6 toxin immunity protein Tsi6
MFDSPASQRIAQRAALTLEAAYTRCWHRHRAFPGRPEFLPIMEQLDVLRGVLRGDAHSIEALADVDLGVLAVHFVASDDPELANVLYDLQAFADRANRRFLMKRRNGSMVPDGDEVSE